MNYHPHVKAMQRSLAASASAIMERDISLWRGSKTAEKEISLYLSKMEHVTTTVKHTTGQPTLSF